MNSLLFPLFISYRSCGEKLIKYQANSSWVIVSVVLMTALYNKALILQREIWCWSPLGLKGLKFLFSVVSIFLFICIAIFIHIKNSVRSALLTGPLLIMTHRKRCMPLQWKKKKKKKKKTNHRKHWYNRIPGWEVNPIPSALPRSPLGWL